ncbi:hypothetical protein T439DRAFT_329967 [Meredithblackwellia eburnea MCA 4105]
MYKRGFSTAGWGKGWDNPNASASATEGNNGGGAGGGKGWAPPLGSAPTGTSGVGEGLEEQIGPVGDLGQWMHFSSLSFFLFRSFTLLGLCPLQKN